MLPSTGPPPSLRTLLFVSSASVLASARRMQEWGWGRARWDTSSHVVAWTACSTPASALHTYSRGQVQVLPCATLFSDALLVTAALGPHLSLPSPTLASGSPWCHNLLLLAHFLSFPPPVLGLAVSGRLLSVPTLPRDTQTSLKAPTLCLELLPSWERVLGAGPSNTLRWLLAVLGPYCAHF